LLVERIAMQKEKDKIRQMMFFVQDSFREPALG